MEIGGGGEADSSPQKCTLVIMPWLEINMKQKRKSILKRSSLCIRKILKCEMILLWLLLFDEIRMLLLLLYFYYSTTYLLFVLYSHNNLTENLPIFVVRNPEPRASFKNWPIRELGSIKSKLHSREPANFLISCVFYQIIYS